MIKKRFSLFHLISLNEFDVVDVVLLLSCKQTVRNITFSLYLAFIPIKSKDFHFWVIVNLCLKQMLEKFFPECIHSSRLDGVNQNWGTWTDRHWVTKSLSPDKEGHLEAGLVCKMDNSSRKLTRFLIQLTAIAVIF